MNAFLNVSIFLFLLISSLVFSSSVSSDLPEDELTALTKYNEQLAKLSPEELAILEADNCSNAVAFACRYKKNKDRTISDCKQVTGCRIVKEEFYSFSLGLTLNGGKKQSCTGVVVWVRLYKQPSEQYLMRNEGSCK